MPHYDFFQNKQCEYFPCHPSADPETFSCIFCYCPLYALGENCGGNFTYTKDGIKDCSNCLRPHKRECYGQITENVGDVIKMVQKKDDSFMAINEYWNDTFHGCIPPDPNYSMKLTQGEETGLLIHLESQQNNVILDFGNVQAINILDEGTQLADPPGVKTTNLQQLRQSCFSSVIYQVDNGVYESYIKSCMTPELYEFYSLRQYNIVTKNYVVEIIAFNAPKITINK